MKRILTTIVLTLGLLLLLSPTVVSAASGIEVVDETGDGKWVDNTWEVTIAPGETKSTALTLYNSSGSYLRVEIPLPSSLDGGNITFELDKSDFIIPNGSSTIVTLSVKASGAATPGTYTTELVEIKTEVSPAPSPEPGPAPLQPTPPEPEEEEPEVEEPEEPVKPAVPGPEPEVPTVEPEEPVEPVEEEPEAIEPEEEEEEEPAVEEPTELEEEEPELGEEPSRYWYYLLCIIPVGLIIGALYIIIQQRRKRKEE